MGPVQPLVSITCPTYNHEKFIAQTLDGFVMQQTDFPFEIIVHDDASTDHTVAVLKEYEEKYPNLFANIYQSENQFSKGHDRVTKITFAAARGKYIALCEGDDYWTDPYKLQKQVDFLEANPDYSICCTNAYYIKESNHFALLENDIFIDRDKPAKTIEQDDLLYQNCILTLTAVFRNTGKSLAPWIERVDLGDWSIHILNSFSGRIKYLADITAAYRKHDKGIFSMQGDKKQLISYIKTGEIIRENIPQPLAQKMIAGQRARLRELLRAYKQEQSSRLFLKYFRRYAHILSFGDKIRYSFTLLILLIKRSLVKIKNVFSK